MTVVHFPLFVKDHFTIQNRLAIEFVTVIAEAILSVAEIFPLRS